LERTGSAAKFASKHMGWPTAKRRLLISVVLIGLGLAVCGWQVEEHVRFRREQSEALINRGRDITSTLGVVLRSQRRFLGVVPKERLEYALQGLIRPGELEAITILGVTGEPIASAGRHVELTPAMLQAPGVYWRVHSLLVMNPADLGDPDDQGARPVLVADEATARSLRPPRRPPEGDGAAKSAPAPERSTVPDNRGNGPTAPNAPAPTSGGGAAPATSTTAGAADGKGPVRTEPPPRPPRFPFGRPPWISKEDYDALIQKQGVHSLVIALSTDQMHRAVDGDLLLRSLVSLLAMGGAIISALAWRNVARNAQLQIRLVKAGEMNAHLKEMNLAAAGLAHETRNPLNLIRGQAQIIALEAATAPKLRDHATSIIEETDRVTVQLNEFINYSKPREPQPAAVQVSRLIADVARTLLPDLEEKRILLQQQDDPLSIEADEQLLRQALFNVLLNATQAVDPGGHIEIRVSATGPRQAMIEICDDGPGVPAEHRASIFKPYVTMRPKGVGLGLAIVAQIAAAHHWEVACLPNEPRGAIFRFSHLKIATPAT
jgi:signal transduction histidine kinase